MIEFDWYQLFVLEEFLATGLVSRLLTVALSGIGVVDILITHANETSITYDGVFLPINFNGENPWVSDGYAVFLDDDGIVYLGVQRDDA